ncbi:alpha/beta fold hydrolase [Flaviaesturariibacter flavus]|uniref:Alpha/beta fold hydrolase n=1 Tax=Flaviaesturariibacter flavus TaxID=2502780 RepID=A0A4R1B8E1_9BACT|nr:alpha/beta fold hydrolase [Flaviaesturariibacter flavus]TCJ13238.1 alpha/beta fold hydrolase [Flaviaesturariibacter flavus]
MRRRLLRRTGIALLLLFVLLNLVAAMHAWRFTHFQEGAVAKTPERGLSFTQKLGVLFLGAHNPRPRNMAVPDTAFQRVQILSDAALEAWWVPVARPRGSVLLCHGYGGSKGGMTDKAAAFRAMGFSTLLLDFRGAGGSPGNQCTIGWSEAVEVRDAARWMRRQQPGPIVLFGTSMGAAAIMRALATDSLGAAAIIVECPFGTMTQTVKNRFRTQGVPAFPMAYLLLFWGGAENGFNAFAHNPEDYAAHIRTPTLLLWGDKDEKVTREETEAIFGRLAGPKELHTFPGAGHENYLRRYAPEWKQYTGQFLERYIGQ